MHGMRMTLSEFFPITRTILKCESSDRRTHGSCKRPVERERGDSPLLGSGVGWGTKPQVRAPASDGWRELARHRLQECDGRAHGNRANRVRRPRKGGAS